MQQNNVAQLIPKQDNTPYKILLAEDKEINQMMAEMVLKSLGCDVDIVRDGKEALSNVQQQNYDLVLMDCTMPIMDGYEATQRIREFEAYNNQKKRTPIIALTAKVMIEDKQKCLDAGMDDYAAKPIREERICDVINKWCANYIDYNNANTW